MSPVDADGYSTREYDVALLILGVRCDETIGEYTHEDDLFSTLELDGR